MPPNSDESGYEEFCSSDFRRSSNGLFQNATSPTATSRNRARGFVSGNVLSVSKLRQATYFLSAADGVRPSFGGAGATCGAAAAGAAAAGAAGAAQLGAAQLGAGAAQVGAHVLHFGFKQGSLSSGNRISGHFSSGSLSLGSSRHFLAGAQQHAGALGAAQSLADETVADAQNAAAAINAKAVFFIEFSVRTRSSREQRIAEMRTTKRS